MKKKKNQKKIIFHFLIDRRVVENYVCFGRNCRACAPYLMEGRAATENAGDRQEWFKTLGPFPTFFFFFFFFSWLTPPPPPIHLFIFSFPSLLLFLPFALYTVASLLSCTHNKIYFARGEWVDKDDDDDNDDDDDDDQQEKEKKVLEEKEEEGRKKEPRGHRDHIHYYYYHYYCHSKF